MMDLLLEHRRAPGDILMMTSAVRDLHKAFPKKYRVKVATSAMAIWNNNPHISNLTLGNPKHFKLSYGASVKQSNQRRAHFAGAFHQHLSECLGVRVPLTDLRADLHLTEAEMDPNARPIKEPYWVIAPGGKSDFSAKIWDRQCWQSVVGLLNDTICVQVGSKPSTGWMNKPKPNHLYNYSPNLKNVVDLVGKTSFRQLMSTIYHAEGVICLISFPMHLAAAFNKPCVVIAGGREGWWWEAYTRHTWEANCPGPLPEEFVEHRYLHTIGQLPCCNGWGCWKSGVGE
jgi:ADP-heptose:LPS heptosyltransferase